MGGCGNGRGEQEHDGDVIDYATVLRIRDVIMSDLLFSKRAVSFRSKRTQLHEVHEETGTPTGIQAGTHIHTKKHQHTHANHQFGLFWCHLIHKFRVSSNFGNI